MQQNGVRVAFMPSATWFEGQQKTGMPTDHQVAKTVAYRRKLKMAGKFLELAKHTCKLCAMWPNGIALVSLQEAQATKAEKKLKKKASARARYLRIKALKSGVEYVE
jgi:hypothetical protein